jgi:hypothetical protein
MMMMKIQLILSVMVSMISASVSVVVPEDLREKIGNHEGILVAGMGNFGHIDYGTNILGKVIVPLENRDGC